MANIIPVYQPALVQQTGNMQTQLPPLAESAAQTWLPNSLVKIVAGTLTLCASADVLVSGLSPDKSHLSTEIPPVAFFGQNHSVFSLHDATLEINISTAGVVGSGGPARSTAVIGSQYGLFTSTTGIAPQAPIGTQTMDTSNTTDKFFEVVGFLDGSLSTDLSARVLVKVLPSIIQT
jgi:hypothetical protein